MTLAGDLTTPDGARGVVLFVHGSGSSRLSVRDRYLAGLLHEGGLATLLLDLLTPHEEEVDRVSPHFRFDVPLLAGRIVDAVEWAHADTRIGHLPLGVIGSSTGAAAALIVAVRRPEIVSAVVSCGGRPDLANQILGQVEAPCLLIVGANDEVGIEHNERAHELLSTAPKELEKVAGAGSMFDEPGTLERVGTLSRNWFVEHLTGS